ncbi:MAG: hypothetical protein JEY71_15155 [Sphaerochaeta sp.]|nr:hypothetical protein [Sphaerochaeta sp.]
MPALLGPVYGLLFTLDSVLYNRVKGVLSTLVLPLSYVVVEFLITCVNPLGNTGMLAYSQYQVLPLMQLSSITGTFGITFLIVWFGSFANWTYDTRANFEAIKKPVAIYALIMVSVFTFGGLRLIFSVQDQGTVRIAGVHVFDLRGAEGQAIWNAVDNDFAMFREMSKDIQKRLFQATQREAQSGAKIVVWSEISPPIARQDLSQFLEKAQEQAKEQGIYLGISPYIVNPNSRDENKLYILSPEGRIVLEHYKFGGNLIEGTVKGNGVLQTVDTPYGRISGVICWDQDFPSVMRQAGQSGVDILLAPTADWKEIDPLHSMVGMTRAIENGYSLFRQDVNGLSLAVNPLGETLAQMDHYNSKGNDWTMVAQVPTKGVPTLYPILGDLFVWICIVALIMIIIKYKFGLSKKMVLPHTWWSSR